MPQAITLRMWRELELFLSTTYASAGLFELSLVLVFFCWLFYARVVAMMELMSSKLFESYDGGIKQSSSSLHHQLTQYQLRKREKIAQARNVSTQSFESALYSLKEQESDLFFGQERRPISGLSCVNCCPKSRSTHPPSPDRLHVVNILNPQNHQQRKSKGLSACFSTIKQCLTFRKFHYPYIFESVLSEEILEQAIGQSGCEEAAEHGVTDPEGIAYFVEKNRKRAISLLNVMHSKMSDTLIRLISWIFFTTMPLLFSGMSIPKAQIEMIHKAASTGLPLIFLPLHRSHIDYLAVSFLLCNSNIKLPLVAAGENLRIPFFGNLMRGLGAFYIKRRMDPVTGKKDKVYRAVLHSYMMQCIEAGNSFEFFIEGGRTRTGKPYMPKGGLLSVFVDAYASGVLEDAYLIPVSINYEKLVEGHFISEISGEPKKPESFSTALYGLWKAVTRHYGHVRIDFNQPFSLHELIRSFQTKVMNAGGTFHIVPSSASLHGTDIVNEEHRQLVESIARHILYDGSQSTAVMSTNALAFLLLYCFRSGASLSQLTFALDQLRERLAVSRKDTGFTGESKDVLEHAAKLFGPGLVQIEKTENDVLYKAVNVLPNILELSYYSNTLIAHYCLEGVVGRTLLCLTAEQENAKVTLERVVDVAVVLCDILQFEFVFTKSCQALNDAIYDVMEIMLFEEVLSLETSNCGRTNPGYSNMLALVDDEDDNPYQPPSPLYSVNRNEEKLRVYENMLEPLIDVYCIVTAYLPKIIGKVTPERCLLKEFLASVKEHIENGSVKYGESLSVEIVKNCVKVLEKWKVLDCHIEDGMKLYYLNSKYDDVDLLTPVINKVDQFKHCNRL